MQTRQDAKVQLLLLGQGPWKGGPEAVIRSHTATTTVCLLSAWAGHHTPWQPQRADPMQNRHAIQRAPVPLTALSTPARWKLEKGLNIVWLMVLAPDPHTPWLGVNGTAEAEEGQRTCASRSAACRAAYPASDCLCKRDQTQTHQSVTRASTVLTGIKQRGVCLPRPNLVNAQFSCRSILRKRKKETGRGGLWPKLEMVSRPR